MASIITASASSGLTQSADTSGVLQLASGVGNLVTIPSVTGTAMVSGNMPAFSAYANATQSVSNATFTKIQINAKVFDTANCYDATTNYRFTPNVAGYYQVNAVLRTSATAITNGIVTIYKNGSSYYRGGENSSTVGNSQLQASTLIYMNGTTDYLELYGYVQGTSSAFNYVSSDITSQFSASMIRSA